MPRSVYRLALFELLVAAQPGRRLDLPEPADLRSRAPDARASPRTRKTMSGAAAAFSGIP